MMSAAMQFRLSRPTKAGNGATVAAHLAQAAKALGYTLPEQQAPEMPGHVEHVFEWYMELRQAFPVREPLPWAEMRAWASLMDIEVHPWEARLLRIFDRAFLAEAFA